MSDQSINILVKTLADTTGLKLTNEQMEMLNKRMAESKPMMSKFSDSLKEHSKAGKENSDILELMHHNHLALHHIMSIIGQETSPMVGRAMMAAMMGPLGAIVAVGTAVEAVTEKWKEYNKTLDDEGKEAAQPALNAVKNIEAAWQSSITEIASYNSAVAQAGKGRDPVEAEMSAEAKAQAAQLERYKNYLEQRKAYLTAYWASQAGVPDGFAEAMLKPINDALTALDGRLAQTKTTFSALPDEFAKRNAPGEQMSLDEKARAAKDKASEAGARLKTAHDELDQITTALKPGESGVSASQQKIDTIELMRNIQDNIRKAKATDMFGPANGETAFAIAHPYQYAQLSIWTAEQRAAKTTTDPEVALGSARMEREHLINRKAQLEDHMEGLETQSETAKIIADNAAKAGKANADRVAEIPTKITPEDAYSALDAGIGAENDLAIGRQTNPRLQLNAVGNEAVRRASETLQMMGGHFTDILDIMNTAHALHMTHGQEVQALHTKYDDLAAKFAAQHLSQ